MARKTKRVRVRRSKTRRARRTNGGGGCFGGLCSVNKSATYAPVAPTVLTKPSQMTMAPIEEVQLMVASATADGYSKPGYSEDRHTVLQGPVSVLCVFDGHGGAGVAELCNRHLPRSIQAAIGTNTDPEAIRAILIDHFEQIDAAIIARDVAGGSTATVCIVTPDHVICANVGDSPALMFLHDDDGTLLHKSNDHDGNNETERARIITAGGTFKTDARGGTRLSTGLAVTRSFGDVVHDKRFVIAIPETYVWKRVPGAYLAVLSDSFAERIRNGMILPVNTSEQITHELLKSIHETASLKAATDNAVFTREAAMHKQGDNTTLILARL